MNYLGKIVVWCGGLLMLGGSLFAVQAADVDDTICYPLEGKVDAAIIVINTDDHFVRCFQGRMLQPVGDSLVYEEDITYVQGTGTPPAGGTLRPLGYSDVYGAVYSLPSDQLVKADEPLVAGTASVPTSPSTGQYILRALLVLLVLYALRMMLRRKESDNT